MDLTSVDLRFLLAQLHMDSLKSQPTRGHIKEALRDLPKGTAGLDKTYEQAMKRIEGQEEGYRDLAKLILSWIVHARRPLSTFELQHALAVRAGMAELDEDFVPEVEVLGSICAGLITVDEQSNTIRLVHYTTQKYFERTGISWFPRAQMDITATCVTYLSFDVFAVSFCQTDKDFEERLQLNALYDYAARNWGHHARAAVAEVNGSILDFLENEAKVSASSQAMMASGSYYGYSQRVPRQMTGIHLTAYFGLRQATLALLKNGHHPDLKDTEYGWTPLLWAAQNGHEAVVKLLLADDRVYPDSKDTEYGRTPLSWAAGKGHEAVVKLLFEKGADVESKDTKYGRTPLWQAAENGHEAVVKLLLEKGADVKSKDEYGRTPLWWAAGKGHEATVKLLLEKGADGESKDTKYGRTPLRRAAETGHEAVVKLLLEKGADVESKDEYGRTPLWWAAGKGHEATVKLLLEKGADVESKAKYGQTPLRRAAEWGNEAVVKLLLEKGADVKSKDWYGRTPLWPASEKGHEAVVKLLLEKGADVESKDKYGEMLLWRAAKGHEAVVKLLLEVANVELRYGKKKRLTSDELIKLAGRPTTYWRVLAIMSVKRRTSR